MNIEWILYLINVFDSLNAIVGITLITWFLFMLIASISWSANDVNWEDREKSLPFFAVKKSLYVFIPVLIMAIFLPSERTMYMIIGANYLKSSAIPSKVELLIEKKLDDYLQQEISPKKSN